MSAVVRSNGDVVQLDGRAEPDENVTEDDVQDTAKLARGLTRTLAILASLRRRWAPRMMDFEGVAVSAGNSKRLAHGFGCKVRWWVVDVDPTSTADPYSDFYRDAAATTENVLVLVAGPATDGTFVIRVEESI